MIYPANFEQKIGFDRLREQIAARCTMRAACARLAGETFSTSAREIARRLTLADEMRLLLDMEHEFPGGEYPDVDHIVAKLRVEGSFLDVEEVVTLHRALTVVGGIVAFILNREEQYPALHARSRGVAAFPEIVQRIDAIVDRFGNIRDNASPALLEIRRAIREREGQAAKRLQAVLSAAKGAGIVDADAQISIRDGKAVIPVSAGNKRKLNGFIHDESATGKTFYVEPVEVVEINNELRELEYAERREVVRILSVDTATGAVRKLADVAGDTMVTEIAAGRLNLNNGLYDRGTVVYTDANSNLYTIKPNQSLDLGDVNTDGRLTIADVMLICRHIMGQAQLSGAALAAADINSDGSVGVADAVLLCQMISEGNE